MNRMKNRDGVIYESANGRWLITRGECDFAGMRRYKVRDAKARTQVTLRCDGESCRTANTGKADAIPDYIFTRVIHDFVKIAKLIATEVRS